MRLMKTTAAIATLTVCVACASSTTGSTPSTYPDQPVGTSGTTTSAPTEPQQVQSDRRGLVPVGQEIDVRLQEGLNSGTATAEQRFKTTTVVDLKQGNAVLIPAGSTIHGVVSSVDKAGNIDRTGRLTLAFDRITVNGRDYEFRGLATQVFESRGIRDEVMTVGTAGAVGAIVGGIIGGVKGAVIGAAVGTGGVIAATEGKDIDLPAGSIVRVRLDTPLQLR